MSKQDATTESYRIGCGAVASLPWTGQAGPWPNCRGVGWARGSVRLRAVVQTGQVDISAVELADAGHVCAVWLAKRLCMWSSML